VAALAGAMAVAVAGAGAATAVTAAAAATATASACCSVIRDPLVEQQLRQHPLDENTGVGALWQPQRLLAVRGHSLAQRGRCVP
jgi:hypothetical protein